MKKHYLVPSVLNVLLIGLVGCGNPAGGDKPPGPQSIVYKSTAGDKVYELTVTETIETSGKAVYTAKTGDTYVLKITDANGTKISTGTVTIANVSGELTLQPSSSGAGTFTITISSGDSMTEITETITFDNGDPETPPGTVTPLPPDSNALPAHVDLSTMTAIQVYNQNGSPYTGEDKTFTHLNEGEPNRSLSAYYGFQGNVVVIDGKLNLSGLGNPTANLDTIEDLEDAGCTVITADSSTQFWTQALNGGFVTDPNTSPSFRLKSEGAGAAGLFYATADATITGGGVFLTTDGKPIFIDVILQAGWNTVVVYETAQTVTIVSGTPNYAERRWTIKSFLP